MTARDPKIPRQVLSAARAATDTRRPPASPKAPVPPAVPARGRKPLARAKVVAALKKLHPMD